MFFELNCLCLLLTRINSMRRRYILSVSFIFLLVMKGLSQTNDSSSAGAEQPKLKISGYVDAYYAWYTDSVGTGNFQSGLAKAFWGWACGKAGE